MQAAKHEEQSKDVSLLEIDVDASSNTGYSADVTSRDNDDEDSKLVAVAVSSSIEPTTGLFETSEVKNSKLLLEGDNRDDDSDALKSMLHGSCPIAAARSVSAESELSEVATGESSLTSASGKEFVNCGLATWERNRELWLDRKGTAKTAKHAKPINVDEIIDAIFTTPKKLLLNGGISETFPQTVPLPQLVDILQDLWEAESL
jgi:hypothetical protein